MNLLKELKQEFPRVKFSVVGNCYEPRSNEDAHYPFGSPELTFKEAMFIRMENVRGGADIVLASDVKAVRKFAAFHNFVWADNGNISRCKF